jgi:hypothetical protein
MEELKSAIQESLPENVTPESLPTDVNKDVTPDSSKAAPEVTPSPKVEQEVPFHEHPRWKEIRERERVASERADRLERQLMEVSNRLSTPQAKDPEEGLAPEEKAFWAKSRQIAREEAQRVKQETEPLVQRELQEQRMLVSSLMYERFQQQHPDVKPGSEEENSIAQKVRSGYSLEDAYNLVTYPQKLKSATEAARKQVEEEIQRKTKQKIAANLEGTGVSSNSPIQSKPRVSIKDLVDHHLAQEGAA